MIFTLLYLGRISFFLHTTYVAAIRFAAAHCKYSFLFLLEIVLYNKYLIILVEMGHIKNSIEEEELCIFIFIQIDFHKLKMHKMYTPKYNAIKRIKLLQKHFLILYINFLLLRRIERAVSLLQQAWTAENLEKSLLTSLLLNISLLQTLNPTFFFLGLRFRGNAIYPMPGHWVSLEKWRRSSLFLKTWLPRTRLIHHHGVQTLFSQNAIKNSQFSLSAKIVLFFVTFPLNTLMLYASPLAIQFFRRPSSENFFSCLSGIVL